MIRGAFRHGEVDSDGFRLRGHAEVYRVESFSDAVFALSVTLLVVSLEVPRSFDDLLRSLSGFFGFAFGFAILVNIWFTQNKFFRRYALHDHKTIVLTSILLFVVVLFTYPLKFLSRLVVVASSDAAAAIRTDQLWQMFLVYGIGYSAVFVVFALLYHHAWTQSAALELTPKERLLTKQSVAIMCGLTLAPIASIAIALMLHWTGYDGAIPLAAGFIYPVVITAAIGVVKARSRRQLENTTAKGGLKW